MYCERNCVRMKKGNQVPSYVRTCREMKELICNLGANQQPAAIEKAGRCLGVLRSISQHFLAEINVPQSKGKHSKPDNVADIKRMVEILDSASTCRLTQSRVIPAKKKFKSVVDGVGKERKGGMHKMAERNNERGCCVLIIHTCMLARLL